jgi:hypothetical protein
MNENSKRNKLCYTKAESRNCIIASDLIAGQRCEYFSHEVTPSANAIWWILVVSTHPVTAETLAYATVVNTDIAAGRNRKDSNKFLAKYMTPVIGLSI